MADVSAARVYGASDSSLFTEHFNIGTTEFTAAASWDWKTDGATKAIDGLDFTRNANVTNGALTNEASLEADGITVESLGAAEMYNQNPVTVPEILFKLADAFSSFDVYHDVVCVQHRVIYEDPATPEGGKWPRDMTSGWRNGLTPNDHQHRGLNSSSANGAARQIFQNSGSDVWTAEGYPGVQALHPETDLLIESYLLKGFPCFMAKVWPGSFPDPSFHHKSGVSGVLIATCIPWDILTVNRVPASANVYWGAGNGRNNASNPVKTRIAGIRGLRID